jgi:hypothetical protein
MQKETKVLTETEENKLILANDDTFLGIEDILEKI